ncbi:unnamed protein product [Prorocentrum cordatum]|uniref:Protein kinase domain-containing protein n=1 Tax=Prorocentrum cordatum TaxID=2364126 RepID=A0ABN9TF45_9DINO|nr:unnamed protein product [Polarella glacialis]
MRVLGAGHRTDPKLPAAAAGGAVKEADMDPSGSWTTQTTACSSTFGTFEDLPAWHFAVEAAPSPPPVAPDGPLEGAAAGSTFSVFCAGVVALCFARALRGNDAADRVAKLGLRLHPNPTDNERELLHWQVRVCRAVSKLGRHLEDVGAPVGGGQADTEYKYVVCDSNGKAEQWEEHRNRRVGRRAGRTAVISETFNARSDFDESASSTCPDQAARFKRSASLALRVLQATRTPKFKRPLLPLREHLRELEAQLSPCYSDVASPSPSPSESPSPTAFAGDRPTPAAFAHIFSPTTGALKATAAEAGAAQHAAAAKPQRPRLRREQSCCDVEPDADGEAAGPGAAFGDQFDLAGQGPLGEGSFGVVWQCVRRRGHDGQSMAAKVMKKQRLSEQDPTTRTSWAPAGRWKSTWGSGTATSSRCAGRIRTLRRGAHHHAGDGAVQRRGQTFLTQWLTILALGAGACQRRTLCSEPGRCSQASSTCTPSGWSIATSSARTCSWPRGA